MYKLYRLCIVVSIALFISALPAHSQPTKPTMRCDFERQLLRWNAASLAEIEGRIEAMKDQIRPRTTSVIPIVFHVVYTDELENISELQIRSQIDILNRDFAGISENFSSLPAEFKLLGGDADLRFCLASMDPDGNPTTGITRTKTQQAYIGTHQQTNGRYSVFYDGYGGKGGWDPERYVNIWVADMDGLLGSATFPGMAPYPEEDGAVIDPDFIGGVGAAALSDPFDRGHTLTHELGHYFGLFHIWGTTNGGCNSDDMVDDTPLQETFYLGCPEYPQYSCGSSDMFMNFMDFTDDRCLALFTRDQIERIQGTLLGLRSMLLDNADACMPPDSGKILLENTRLFYAPTGGQIIIILEVESTTPREVTLYSIDGRMIHSEAWLNGSIFWLDADHLPAGIYIIQLESGGERVSAKVFVSR